MRSAIFGCGSTNCTCVYNAEMAREALDRRDAEIERLRAENAQLKSTDMAVAMAEMSLRDEIVRLRARVAMLERVMQEIADFCEEGDRRTFVAIANTVRAALEVKP